MRVARFVPLRACGTHQDDVAKCIAELRAARSDDVRHRAAKKLRDLVKGQQRELTAEDFNKLMGDLNRWVVKGCRVWSAQFPFARHRVFPSVRGSTAAQLLVSVCRVA